MKHGFIRAALGRLSNALCRDLDGRPTQPLWKLDDRLLDDIGLTRDQAREIDRESAARSKTRDKQLRSGNVAAKVGKGSE
jgi:hypothetical protein